ncbi:ring-infected erythrocyte surface antigen domain-containing protein [Anaerosporobacter faecicola]|uniref:hypothetical protein n=1 Tax=Anaerosporobacter faecicola TaxID=2718714 RepID=UPI001439B42B|nr:hypothetical protein [Anaerosporobacter faecicola]
MHSCSSFEQIQQKSAMYLASNKKLKSTANSEIDLCDLCLFEVTNQSYDSIQTNLYAIENVLDAMKEQKVTLVYVIQGTGNNLRYYYGVAPYGETNGEQMSKIKGLQEGEETLYASFTTNFPNSTIVALSKEEKEELQNRISKQEKAAVLEGVPGVITGTISSLGMDRFTSVMEKEEFVVMVLAKPLLEEQIMQITWRQQELLDYLAPLLGYTKVNQKSNVNEASSSVEQSRASSKSKTNTVSSQLQFQLYSANTSIPLHLDNGTLRQIEEIFFSNGIDYDDSIELINELLTQLENRNEAKRLPEQGITRTREAVENDTTVSPPILNNLIVTTKEIPQQEQQYMPRRQGVGFPFWNIQGRKRRTNRNNEQSKLPNVQYRTQQNTQQQNTEQHIEQNTEQRLEQSIEQHIEQRTEQSTGQNIEHNTQQMIQHNNRIDRLQSSKTDQAEDPIGNTLFNYLGYEQQTSPNTMSMEEQVNSSQEERDDSQPEDIFLNQVDRFSLANISRQDSRSQAKLNSCSKTNRLFGSKRDSKTDICSITEKYENQVANAWFSYVVDVLEKRLLYGENRGLYVFSTVIYGKDQLTREKVIAAWNGMNEYTTVSKVPMRSIPMIPCSNVYCSYLNFQIPKYCYSENGYMVSIPMQECLARSAYSQIYSSNWISGGNWVSSKELRYYMTLPLKSTAAITTYGSKKEKNTLQIMERNACIDYQEQGGITKKDYFEDHDPYEENRKRMKRLVEQYQKPFMMIEYHTGRYSKAFGDNQKVERYDVLRCAGHMLRMNPFELFPEELLSTHIDLLAAILRFSYGFDSTVLAYLKKGIRDSYVAFGWNLNSSTNEKFKNQAYTKEVKAFPTIYDVLNRVEEEIRVDITDKELQLKCLTKVKDTLQDWTIGRKGALLNAEHNMNFAGLFDQNCCLSLEELVNKEDRCFFVLLYLFRCVALRKSQGRYNTSCNHLLFVEGLENFQKRKNSDQEEYANACNTIQEYLESSSFVGEYILSIT